MEGKATCLSTWTRGQQFNDMVGIWFEWYTSGVNSVKPISVCLIPFIQRRIQFCSSLIMHFSPCHDVWTLKKGLVHWAICELWSVFDSSWDDLHLIVETVSLCFVSNRSTKFSIYWFFCLFPHLIQKGFDVGTLSNPEHVFGKRFFSVHDLNWDREWSILNEEHLRGPEVYWST